MEQNQVTRLISKSPVIASMRVYYIVYRSIYTGCCTYEDMFWSWILIWNATMYENTKEIDSKYKHKHMLYLEIIEAK